jgi:hypothetical protein
MGSKLILLTVLYLLGDIWRVVFLSNLSFWAKRLGGYVSCPNYHYFRMISGLASATSFSNLLQYKKYNFIIIS